MFVMLNYETLEYYKPALKRCRNVCTILSLIVLVLVVVIFLAIFATNKTQKIHIVYIDGNQSIFSTNDKFLSLALDSSVIANHFKYFNMTDLKLLKVIRALSPAYLRIGGTMADRLIFVKSDSLHFKHNVMDGWDGGECAHKRKYCDYLLKPNFTMNGYEWLQLNKMAKMTNLEIIFGLNVLQRFDNGTWDYTNGEELIEFSNRHNLKLNWELGNEPNAFSRQFNYVLPPKQLAEDFHTLRRILKKYPKYRNSLLLGPDVTRPQADHNESEEYLNQFLANGGSIINAVTWHQYYFNGRSAKMSDFLNPEIFENLKWQISAIKEIVANNKLYGKPIWLGETSSAYGGGAPRLSNRFLSTFIWLDKLGIAAKYGLDLVIRQSIFQGYYSLINYDYEPTPDWWISILYKKLVAPKVVNCDTTRSLRIRLYCHCSKPESYFENIPSITVFGINLNNHKVKVRFEGLVPLNSEQTKNLTVHAYILSTVQKINSKYIFLNQRLLKLTENDNVPILPPKTVLAYPYVEMPAFSLAFWVMPVGTLLPC